MHHRPLRQLFTRNGTWAIHLSQHQSEIREVVIDNVTRMIDSLGLSGHGLAPV